MIPAVIQEVSAMDETLREQIALFRYGVISELVSRPLAPGEKERLLEAIAEKTWEIPGSPRHRIGKTTAWDWVELYQAMGFAGLKPRSRSDRGASRALPERVQELLLQLRRERTRASVDSLIRAVRLSGQVAADQRLAPSTIYRLFAAHGFESPPADAALPDALAFTHPFANDLWLSDVMHGPRLYDLGRRRGSKTYLIAFLDDASRLAPFAAFYLAESSACFQEALKQAFLAPKVLLRQRLGVPQPSLARDLCHARDQLDPLAPAPAPRPWENRALLPTRPQRLPAAPHRGPPRRARGAQPRVLGLARERVPPDAPSWP
jgi:hypothetical protein